MDRERALVWILNTQGIGGNMVSRKVYIRPTHR